MHLLYACFFLVLLQQSHATTKTFPECSIDGIYRCYTVKVPSMMQLVAPETQLSKANKAVVMMNAFNARHYRVVLQSLDDSIDSIVFKANNAHVFSCSIEEMNNVKQVVFKTGIDKNVAESKDVALPIKCEGDVKDTVEIIAKINENTLQKYAFETKSGADVTKAFMKSIDSLDTFFSCDPKQLRYKKERMNKTKAYRKVIMNHMDQVFCNDAHIFSKFEYRKDKDSVYVELDKITCEKNLFSSDGSTLMRRFKLDLKDGGAPIILDKDIDVRCVGEAKFFCDYDPVWTPHKQRMHRSRGVTTVGAEKESKLECPPTHPYAVIKGETYKNPNIECLNIGGTYTWTHGTDFLQRDGTAVHCDKEMKCPQVARSFLKSGAFLNGQNIPICNIHGDLQIEKEGKRRNVKFHCDRTTGLLTFETIDFGEMVAWGTETPDLHCQYPQIESNNARIDRDNEKLRWTLITSTALVVAPLCGVIMFFVLRRINARQQEMIRRANDDDLGASKRFRDNKEREIQEAMDEREKIKSGTGTTTTKRTSAVQSGADSKSVKAVNLDEYFADENGEVIEIPAPKGHGAKIAAAISKNAKNRLRMDNFREGFPLVYGEEAAKLLADGYSSSPKLVGTRRQFRENKKIALEEQQAKPAPEK